MRNRTNLNFQVCIYPFFDGGFYITGPVKYNLMVRVSMGFIDFRIWWDRHKKPSANPIDYIVGDEPLQPGPLGPIVSGPWVEIHGDPYSSASNKQESK